MSSSRYSPSTGGSQWTRRSGARHLVIGLAERGGLPVCERPGHNHQAHLAWTASENRTKVEQVVVGRCPVHHLKAAAQQALRRSWATGRPHCPGDEATHTHPYRWEVEVGLGTLALALDMAAGSSSGHQWPCLNGSPGPAQQRPRWSAEQGAGGEARAASLPSGPTPSGNLSIQVS